MSKSKNNGVDPQTLIERYGADTVRLYIIFAAPPDQSLEWSDEGVEGAFRFIRRLWALAVAESEAIRTVSDQPPELDEPARIARREIHSALKKALYDYERQQFNTVVSGCMTMVNALYRLESSTARVVVIRGGTGDRVAAACAHCAPCHPLSMA
jgi:leucyl-tRNA synthetase (EC 6.1.1.4)